MTQDTMNEITNKQMYRIIINSTIQKVWDTLTKEGEVLPFFFGTVLHTTNLSPGAPIRMRSPNGKYTAVVGEVLEIDPPHRYAHTFKFTSLNDPVCTVIYELKEVPEGVEFTLITENVPPKTKTAQNMKSGGVLITKSMKHYVETGRPNLMSRIIMISGTLFPFLNPKQSRSEHWPLDKTIS